MELSQYNLPNDRGNRTFYHEQIDALQSCTIGSSKVQTFTQNDHSSDRFLLKIPYCAKQLQWDVFFDSGNPTTPPDFIFEEGFESFISLSQVKSLSKWNPTDKDSLTGVILELVDLWKEYQKTIFSQTANDRLQFEFNTLESERQGVEYLVYGPDEYRCLVPLSFDFVKIEPCPRLFVQFNSNSADPPETRLVLTPNSFWEYLLQGTKLPAWNKDTCTVEYIRTLTEQVKISFDAFQHRKKYIDSLKLLFGSCLEYDGYSYQKISFLFEHNTFTFMLLVSLTSEFPTKQPVLTIQAPTLSRSGNLVTIVYDSYPYSPRWQPDEMARRARDFLVKTFDEVKQKCTELIDK